MTPALYIFSGLPGAGKSTLARRLAVETGAAYLRIDTIEQALREVCGIEPHGEGYRLAYRIAADNLCAGLSVVADSCNPIDLTRREWEEVALQNGAAAVNIEVVCSDRSEHKRRVEERVSDIPGLMLPTWRQVAEREYHPWTTRETSRAHVVTIDTAGKTPEESFVELLELLLDKSYIQTS